jgi:hypothetical protein
MSAETSVRNPLRARFAMWVLGLISPWLQLWEEEPPEGPHPSDVDPAYQAGIEDGYQQAQDDLYRDRGHDDFGW